MLICLYHPLSCGEPSRVWEGFFRFEGEANTVPELTGACQAWENDQSELHFCLRVMEANDVIGGCQYQTREIQWRTCEALWQAYKSQVYKHTACHSSILQSPQQSRWWRWEQVWTFAGKYCWGLVNWDSEVDSCIKSGWCCRGDLGCSWGSCGSGYRKGWTASTSHSYTQ